MISFPKILQLGDPRVAPLLREGEVEITEKIDGSMFGFGLTPDGVLQWRSKGQVLTDHPNPQKLFLPVIRAMLDREALIREHLRPGVWVFGETLTTVKHNTLVYERVPKGHLALFGVWGANNNGWAQWEVVNDVANALQFDVAPRLYYGPMPPGIAHLEALLDYESILGKEKVEGVVIRHRTAYWNGYGPEPSPVMVKYVRADFRERNSKTWEGAHTSASGKVETILQQYCTNARWDKAIQHLAEDGKLLHRMQDMPMLVHEVERDVLEECEAEIKEAIFKAISKDLKRVVTRGLAEHYKLRLAEAALQPVLVEEREVPSVAE